MERIKFAGKFGPCLSALFMLIILILSHIAAVLKGDKDVRYIY